MRHTVYNKDIEINETGIERRYDIVDSHLHFVDFTQSSDGFAPLTKAMDAAGVSESIIFGMPIVKKWDYLREQIDAARKSKADRMFVLSKDFNFKVSNSQQWLMEEDFTYPATSRQCTILSPSNLK